MLVKILGAGGCMLDEPYVRSLLVERVDGQRQAVGMAVGIVDVQGRRVVACGSAHRKEQVELSGETIFEIGSLTKVFTALLLQEMALRGEVALDDPVAKHLPAEVRVPEFEGRAITLLDLATHTSGLPRLPGNLRPFSPQNPYRDYTAELLYQCLSSCRLTRAAGAEFEYSNLGGGLLGFVLARRAGMDYEDLVRARITSVLGMNDTSITLSASMRARLATGHNAARKPVSGWEMGVLAGAGGLRASVNDLLTFLAANLGFVQTPLAEALSAMLLVRRPTGQARTETALGWMVTRTPDRRIVWHNGGTGGYRTYMGFDAIAGVGVAVFSNTANQIGVDDIGMHVLRR